MKVGEVIGGRFELRQVLGEGGMGQVFKAWDTELERFVAIKALLSQFLSDPGALDEMKQEVRISQRLTHPAIVAVYDYRVHDRTPYIIMEFVDGHPLHHHLFRQPQKKLDEPAFLSMADLILAGVAYAHERGVVHRDLKPANIMVQPAGPVKLMDFGIAAAIKATYTRTTGRTSGLTIQYSSPEQINGEPPNPSMDIYSLGCVFYEMLTGHPPFYQGEVLHQQLTRQAPPMPGVSSWLNAAVLACLLKDPRKRLHSILEVRAALNGDRTVKIPRQARQAAAAWERQPASGPLQALGIAADSVSGQPDGVLPSVRARMTDAWRQSPLAMPLLTGALGVLVLSVVLAAILTGRSSPALSPTLEPARSFDAPGPPAVASHSVTRVAEDTTPDIQVTRPSSPPEQAARGPIAQDQQRPDRKVAEAPEDSRVRPPAAPPQSPPAAAESSAATDAQWGADAWRSLEGLLKGGDLGAVARQYQEFLQDRRSRPEMDRRAGELEGRMFDRAQQIEDPVGRIHACELIAAQFPWSARARKCAGRQEALLPVERFAR